MKTNICLVAGSLCLLGMAAQPKGVKQATKEVVLTASQVVSAGNIEEAIELATDYGTHPGIVTLDSREGDFSYTEPDRSINIFCRGVTLRSLTGARIVNCGDGVFLDPGFPGDLVVEGITFICEAVGVSAAWTRDYDRVIIRGNTFDCGLGLGVARSRDWVIADNHFAARGAGVEIWECSNVELRGNVIRAGGAGVNASLSTAVEFQGNHIEGGWAGLFIEMGTEFLVMRNTLLGSFGVFLQHEASGNRLVNNNIAAQWQGVVLGSGANENDVIANRIAGVEGSGISLEWETSGNRVHGNRVACAEGAPWCEIIQAAPDVWEANDLSGNTAW